MGTINWDTNQVCMKCSTLSTIHRSGLCVPCRTVKCSCGTVVVAKKGDEKICYECRRAKRRPAKCVGRAFAEV